MLNAGLIVVSTTNAIGLADATAVQALIPDAPLLLIDIDPDGVEHAGLRPAHHAAPSPRPQVIAKINELLVARRSRRWADPDAQDPSTLTMTLPSPARGA